MLESGQKLGPYEILGALGAGGMGEVYRARDTRLGRTVAVKVLSQDLGGRPEVLQRFEREARAVSALNHPNICTLYDVGTEGGKPYLVMEYLEGETLADRIARGPLALKDAIEIAIQIGEALDQAHGRGIVHRDLKPGNAMLTGGKGSNTVKLLDFGLAKVSELPAAPGSQTSLPTVVQGLTQEGSIVGTFQYMAPEQLEGAEADHRTDIFAFGCVLYEMLTGRRAFEGKSHATLISAIMTTEPPPVSAAQPLAPPALDRIVKKCLAKDAGQRWQSIRDLVSELRWISESGSQMAAAPAIVRPRRRRFAAASIAAAFLALAFLALLVIHLREKPPEQHVTRFLAPLPEKAAFRFHDGLAVSPDGTRLAFVAASGQRDQLYVRSLDSVAPRVLLTSEPGTILAFPFWSPDGRNLAVHTGNKLRKLDATGGPATIISDAPSILGGTWNQDGVILLPAGLQGGGLLRVSASGGTPAALTKPDASRGETAYLWPFFLPDGSHFLFTVVSAQVETAGIYAGSLDSPHRTRLLPDQTNALYQDGMLLFVRNGILTAQPFDAARLKLTGEAFPLAEQVASFGAFAGSPVAASGGTLVYRVGEGIAPARLTWFDRKGAAAGAVGDPADYTNPALSPDGRTLAVCVRDPGTKTRDIWLMDLARGTKSRLTFDPADDLNPVWSPDGQRVAFTSARHGTRELYVKAASGTGADEFLGHVSTEDNAEDWTQDGRLLIFNATIPGQRRGVYAIPMPGERKPFPVLQGAFQMDMGQVSPNGKWIAYVSRESGRPEVFVQNFPPSGGKWQISNNAGAMPQWSRDGKELFYLEGDTRLMAVAVKTAGDKFDADVPKLMFEAQFIGTGRNTYVVSPDGQKFLGLVRNEATNVLPMTVVLNWPAGLRR